MEKSSGRSWFGHSGPLWSLFFAGLHSGGHIVRVLGDSLGLLLAMAEASVRPTWRPLPTPGRQMQPARFPPTQPSVGDKGREGTATGQPHDKFPWASSCVHCSALVVLSTVKRKSPVLSD